MTLAEELAQVNSVFIDTAPIIYYIEAHPQFGPLMKEVVSAFQSGILSAYSSVITLTEVLPKPVGRGDEKLARKFAEFLKYGRNLTLLEISEGIAEGAGKLRGRYPFLKTIDAIQLAAALDVGAGAFLTNDLKLQQFNELAVLIVKDYL
ncbi:MAG: PIN domain-containing protein [Deltaproteobacteria bacterium]|nr:PIN domain-containing protein [Deltaproteobacteria bacterium]MBM4323498.1 PIN domain-containing protein [Deltaproteobacteria bacterium]